MKKNLILLTGAAVFVALFYNREPGLNLALFALASWLAVFLTTKKENHTKTYWWLTAALVVAAGSFAWYGDPASFLAVFFVLILMVCKAHQPLLTILLVPFAGLINFASFIFRAPVLTNWLPVNNLLTAAFYKKVIYYFIIPGALAAGFLLIYSSSSELFQSFFYINWNADFLQIGFLTALGFFFMFCFVHYWTPAQLLMINDRLSDHFSGAYAGQNRPDAGFYRKSAEISLIVLNIIIAFFIGTYCIEQFGRAHSENSLSSALHERVYLLIFSIAMAVFVILLFFRGQLNFTANAQLLKKAAFTWIALNCLLLIVVGFKNSQYIAAYGLTFKRLGVYGFLLLSAIGLAFTTLKIKHKKTNSYLIARMAWASYTVLVIGAAINWSWVVTRYNLDHAKTFDLSYAKSLPFNKQLLFDSGQLTKEALSQIRSDHQQRPFLSQNLYYTTLKAY